jgi:hypothetical protein
LPAGKTVMVLTIVAKDGRLRRDYGRLIHDS